jgi:Rrf2 family protein
MRLEVTRKTDLAVRALCRLAETGEVTKGPTLAAAVDSSAGFLAHAMTPLVRAGWVRSEPGPTGGYRLVVALASISVLDVVEAVEGPTDSGRCVLVDRDCGDTGPCALHPAWSRARERLVADLDALSLADSAPVAVAVLARP